MMRRLAALLVPSLAALPLLLLAGCERRSDGPELVLYCAFDQEHAEPLLADFEKQTGVHVKPNFDNEVTKTVGLTAQLLNEKSRPRADVFWNNEIVNTLRLKRLGCLQPYRSPCAADVPDRYKDADGCWTGFAARARVFIVNRDHCPAARMPESYRDYLDPARKGEWAIAKPIAGTTATHAAVLFDLLGEEKAKEFFRGIVGNDAALLSGNGNVMREVREGHQLYGFTDTDDFHVAELDGYPVVRVYPDQNEGEIGCLVIPNTVSLIAGAPHPDAAKRFIDWLLSKEVEARLANGRTAQIPVRPGVAVPAGVKRISELKVMDANFERAAEKFDQVQKWIEDELLSLKPGK